MVKIVLCLEREASLTRIEINATTSLHCLLVSQKKNPNLRVTVGEERTEDVMAFFTEKLEKTE